MDRMQEYMAFDLYVMRTIKLRRTFQTFESFEAFRKFCKAFRKIIYIFFCKEEPDDVNNFTKSFAHILNFELYWPYYILFNEWRYFFTIFAFYRYTVS